MASHAKKGKQALTRLPTATDGIIFLCRCCSIVLSCLVCVCMCVCLGVCVCVRGCGMIYHQSCRTWQKESANRNSSPLPSQYNLLMHCCIFSQRYLSELQSNNKRLTRLVDICAQKKCRFISLTIEEGRTAFFSMEHNVEKRGGRLACGPGYY